MSQACVRVSLAAAASALAVALPAVAGAAAYTPNDPYPAQFIQGIFNRDAQIVWPAPVDPNTQLWNLSPTWHLEMINAQAAWGLTKGSSTVRVGVIDSEFDTAHPDLQAKIVDTYNTESGSPQYDKADVSIGDDPPHGTSTAGLIAADTDNSLGISGVGFDSSLVLIKVGGGGELIGDTNCKKFSADLSEGIRAAADRTVRVINISMACRRLFPDLKAAVEYANGKDVVIVASAGNGQETAPFVDNYPAALDGVIAVAALDSTRNLTSYSSRGPWVDIAAPAERVWTTTNRFSPVDPGNQWYYNGQGRPVIFKNDLGYQEFNGTSAAAPIVAGVVALIRSARPDLNRVEVEDILLSSAKDLGIAGRDPSYGAGLVDANAAVVAALAYLRQAPPVSTPKPAAPAATYTLRLLATTNAKFGARAILRGRISPARVGINVRILRRVGARTVVVGTVKTTSGGFFNVRIPTGRRGKITLRVSVGRTARAVIARIA